MPKFPKLLILWLVAIGLLYAVTAFFMASSLQDAKARDAERFADRLDRNATEAGRTGADQAVLETLDESALSKVHVGVYIDRIADLSLRNSSWQVDFYVWFRWSDRRLNPGASFQVIDGEIIRRALETEHEENGEKYALYRVQARISKFFGIQRFPRDDHLLTLRIEDTESYVNEMLYVPDVEGSSVSSRVEIPGYDIIPLDPVEKPHSYKTQRGDPRVAEDFRATYSQLIYGISIQRPGWALYMKMFLGTFSSVAIAMLAFLVHPAMSGPRFAVGVGAFFAGVASTYVVSNLLPQNGQVGLTDYVTSISLVTIFLTIVTSAISVTVHEREGLSEARQRFDLLALGCFAIGYIALNVVIAQAASI